MKAIPGPWMFVAIATSTVAFVWSGAARAVTEKLRQKPVECDSCDRAGRPVGGDDGSTLRGLKREERPPREKFIPEEELLSTSGLAEPSGGDRDQGEPGRGRHDNDGGPGDRKGNNVFVNDPCLDPPPEAPFPENFLRTVQSETEIAALNNVEQDDDHPGGDDRRHGGEGEDDDHGAGGGSGQLMVAGYNDSYGFYDNRQGLSGFSYSTDGGRQWIDGGGLPPRVPSGAAAGTPGSDAYFGDPVVVVHHRSKTFYYASIYQNEAGGFSLSVNRGQFKVAPQQVPVESFANTRCEGDPTQFGVPDPPAYVRKRVIWEPPVEVVAPVPGGDGVPNTDDDDFFDKEWLYVDQNTGYLYLTYTRFGGDGSTPIELVRSFDGGHTWTPPAVIVPNLFDTFNQATQPVVTPSGRVIVTWFARTFPAPAFVERQQRVEVAYSDNCSTPAGACTFGAPVIVALVNPQGEPPGYNRGRTQILNTPFITVDKGRDDGKFTKEEKRERGFGNVYITYFDGRTPFAAPPNPNPVFSSAGDIHLSTSATNGSTWGPEVKVNDDTTPTSHVFPSVQVNERHQVFVTWLDRRVDPVRNFLTDTYGDISESRGAAFGGDARITDVSTDWFSREDAFPDYGDYNSSEVVKFKDFVSIWADGRFPPPAPLTCTPAGVCTRPANRSATPDSLFAPFDGAKGDGHHEH